jgi:hypothetical protein
MPHGRVAIKSGKNYLENLNKTEMVNNAMKTTIDKISDILKWLCLGAALLAGAGESMAQTFGGGQTVIGTSNVWAKSVSGSYITNTVCYTFGQETLTIGGIVTNSETIYASYGFFLWMTNSALNTITSNWIPISTLIINSNYWTGAGAAQTNGGSWTTNLPPISVCISPIVACQMICTNLVNVGALALTNSVSLVP